jgi:hypothetical protein
MDPTAKSSLLNELKTKVLEKMRKTANVISSIVPSDQISVTERDLVQTEFKDLVLLLEAAIVKSPLESEVKTLISSWLSSLVSSLTE